MKIRDFQLRKNELPEDGTIRIIHRQIDLVSELCRNIPESAEVSVHEIRKGIKRIRSVIRLLRFSFGEDRFQSVNKRFGEISLLLADLRRSDAHLTTLTALLGKIKKGCDPAAIKSATRVFKRRKARLYRILFRDKNILSLCLKQLSEARKELLKNPPVGITEESVLAGYGRIYRSGRNRLKKALEMPSMENNHALRKAVKNLWNQTQVLQILWPGILNPTIRSLSRLGDLLGKDHDLAELEEAITGKSILEGKDLEQALKVFESQRKKYQRSAWQLAAKIFAETPSALIRRMGTYWEVQKEVL